jgi:hypothetical protein
LRLEGEKKSWKGMNRGHDDAAGDIEDLRQILTIGYSMMGFRPDAGRMGEARGFKWL